MASIRENLMEGLKTRLQAISTSGGYNRNVNVVERLKAELPDTPTTPIIYLYEGDERKDSNDASGRLQCTLEAMVIFVDTDYTDPNTTANAMLEDVTKALGDVVTLTDADGATGNAELYERGNEVIMQNELVFVGMHFDALYFHLLGDQTRF